jgi:hypothetical protein
VKKSAILPLVIGSASVTALLLCLPQAARAGDQAPAPPFLVHADEYLVLSVAFDEAQVRKLVPAQVRTAAGARGMVVVYKASSPGMLGDYSASYITLDVEGFDSPSGTKGRWMLAGLYGPSDRAFQAIRGMFGPAVRQGSSRIVDTPGSQRGYASVDGADVLSIEVRPRPEPCSVVGGSVNYLAAGNGRGVTVVPIASSLLLCGADPVGLKITARAGDPISQIGAIRVVGAALVRDLSAAFSPAQVR